MSGTSDPNAMAKPSTTQRTVPSNSSRSAASRALPSCQGESHGGDHRPHEAKGPRRPARTRALRTARSWAVRSQSSRRARYEYISYYTLKRTIVPEAYMACLERYAVDQIERPSKSETPSAGSGASSASTRPASGTRQSYGGHISAAESGAPGTQLGTLCGILAALDLEFVIRPKTKARAAEIEDIF